MVDRVKPWFMVNGLAHGSRIMVSGTWFMVHGALHKVLLENGGLPCIFPSISTLTLDTIVTLSGT